ncbi:putative cytochrome P450 monooxygenase [Lophiostoma macrostomum CBS 122681]|uniref:Putative cytochrome P450 monooxygenase n=1 Tax=Lophiostoma macrostomum CBS 122681 TaxID=1314788 RepID=A0A6A6T2W8_9PLEO|nr:putative cytochrome P450 monooxygenase [Lophiostoma macrostomum CBS 122681]
MLAELLGGVALSYSVWSIFALQQNYRRATSMGIPLIWLPVDPLNVPFQVIEPHLFRLLDLIPFQLPPFIYHLRRGWYFGDKADTHLKHGPVWALVTPRDIHVHLSDAEAIHSVFSRRGDFIRPQKMYKLLEVYGPCISTADATNWPRHRKILAAPFNEAAMGYVWSETLSQTKQLVAAWTSSSPAGIASVAKDTRTLSLNVLAAVGFRRSFSFRTSDQTEAEKESGMLSYRDALQLVLDNAILLMLVPYRHLVHSWLPISLRKIGRAVADFRDHMAQMLEAETKSLNLGEKGSGSLMTSFIRALDVQSKETNSTSVQGLSVDEIFGNTFVINFAGHDTTANTLAFSTLLLAAYPEVQEWIAEEVQEVVAGIPGDEWNYAELYPRLPRCRAVLFETLRLYPPIMALPKWTNDQPQSLRVGDREIIIPPHTSVQPNIIAVQTHPQYWPEPRVWKPSRWITAPTGAAEKEEMYVPPRDTFIPWSDGPQNCLGVKFSQVEFVAVLVRLLLQHRLVVIKQRSSETDAETTARVWQVANECDAQMLLRMKDPDRVKLKLRRVE